VVAHPTTALSTTDIVYNHYILCPQALKCTNSSVAGAAVKAFIALVAHAQRLSRGAHRTRYE